MLRAINNGRIVTPGGVVEGSVVIEGGRISGVSRQRENGGHLLDAGGRYVLPGLVDLHSDAIENQLAPRPEADLPPELAFLEMDRLFASSGITTGFDALVFMERHDRGVARALGLYDLISKNRHEGLVRHGLHLRCEFAQHGTVETVEGLLPKQEAKIVSFMDHTPGRGKFRSLGWFRRLYLKDHPEATDAEVEAAFANAETGDHTLALDRLERLARAAKDAGALLCSHDDDTPEKVEALARRGVRVSEFPIDAATARKAKGLGLRVCMGAPNAVRGRSTGGSVSATEAVKLGLVDVLCSDYHPPSMLQAAFKLARGGILPLHEAVGLVSSGPARAVGLADRGEVKEGAMADLIVVGERFGLPAVTHTIVGGSVILSSDPADRSRSATPAGTYLGGRDSLRQGHSTLRSKHEGQL